MWKVFDVAANPICHNASHALKTKDYEINTYKICYLLSPVTLAFWANLKNIFVSPYPTLLKREGLIGKNVFLVLEEG